MTALFLSLLALTAPAASSCDSVAPAPPSEARLALRKLVSAADSGNPKALFQLSRVFETGFDSIPVDTKRAAELLLKSAEAGYPPAQNLYGFRLYNTARSSAGYDEGLEWITRAASAGDATACSNLGWLLLEGHHNNHNPADAAFWFQKAADKGVPQAMAMLGDLYKEGRGVPADTIRARELYNDAIKSGLIDAQYKLLEMDGFAWKRLSAEEALALGESYYPAPAPALGVTLFHIAAEKGSPEAHLHLADAMTRAVGTPYDHDKSIYHYLLAARAGNADARRILSELLEIFPDALKPIAPLLQAQGLPALTSEESLPAHWQQP